MRNRNTARRTKGSSRSPHRNHATLASLMNRHPLETTGTRLPLATFGANGDDGDDGGGSSHGRHIPDDRIAVRFLLQD